LAASQGFRGDFRRFPEADGVVKNLQTAARLQYSNVPRLPRSENDRCHR